MKTVVAALLIITLVSCSKETVTAPQTLNQTNAATTAVAYKDNSISVVNFEAQQANGTINVSFTTLYQKNIAKLEILKGATASNLCSFYQEPVHADSYSAIPHLTQDANNSHATELYYMVKYTLVNGDWGYTPVFKLSL